DGRRHPRRHALERVRDPQQRHHRAGGCTSRGQDHHRRPGHRQRHPLGRRRLQRFEHRRQQMTWLSLALTLLKIVSSIMTWAREQSLIDEGYDKAIAETTQEILRKT